MYPSGHGPAGPAGPPGYSNPGYGTFIGAPGMAGIPSLPDIPGMAPSYGPVSNRKRGPRQASKAQHNENGKRPKKLRTVTYNTFDIPPTLWDGINRALSGPRDRNSIKKMHIYDFDKCLLRTPDPNPLLLRKPALQLIESEHLAHGGWWKDPRFLQPVLRDVGSDDDKWTAKWWNRLAVDLAKESFKDPEALSVLITGRNAQSFTGLIEELLARQHLKFHALILRKNDGSHIRPTDSTLEYKCTVLGDLLNYFGNIEQVSIYDDRPKHLGELKSVVTEYSLASKKDILVNAVHVQEFTTHYDPLLERELVLDAIEEHNNNLDVMTNPGHHGQAGHVDVSLSIKTAAYYLDPESVIRLASFLQSKMDRADFENCRIMESIPLSVKTGLPPAFADHQGTIVDWMITDFARTAPHIWSVKIQPVTERLYALIGNSSRIITVAHRSGGHGKRASITWVHLADPILLRSTIEQRPAIECTVRR